MSQTVPVIAAQSEPVLETLAIPQSPSSDQKYSYDRGMGFKDYLKNMSRHKMIIVVLSLMGLLVGYFLSQVIKDQYTAVATIKIDAEPVQILDYGIDVHQKKSMINNAIFFQTQYKLLRSKKLAKRVIEDLSLESYLQSQSKLTPGATDVLERFKEEVVALRDQFFTTKPKQIVPVQLENIFLESLTIRPLKDSQIVEVTFQSNDEQLSIDVVNGFIKNFMEQRAEIHRVSADRAATFLRNELLTARGRLQESEEELLTYAKQNNIIDTKGDRSIIAQSLEDLSAAYIKAKQQRIMAESVYAEQREAAGDLYAADSNLISDLKERVSAVSVNYTEKLKTYKPDYPEMLALRSQINELNKQISAERGRAKRSVANDMKASFQSSLQQERRLNSEILSYEKQLLNFEDRNLQYTNLQRETETNRVHYEGLLQRLKEVTVVGSSSNESIDIIDDAYPSVRPSSKRSLLNALLGMIVGLFAGAGLALLKSLMNQRVQSLEDLQDMQLPYHILTALPKVKHPKKNNIPLLAANKPNSSMAESIRYLYANLTMGNTQKIPRVLLITSSIPGEGKSSTVINLASMLAKNGKRVLIIDGDLRKPTIHKHLRVDNSEGLSNYLAGLSAKLPLKKVASKSPLFVIPAGPMVSDPVGILSTQKMIDLCATLRDSFDQVIIDSPPVLGMADALVLSNRSDATLFVVSNDKPSKKDIHSALRNLEKGFANIVGIAFSKEKSSRHNQYYKNNSYSDGRSHLVLS
ncbi:MAG: Capsular exopolysaccharide family [uncultured Thiotrichaceae bacterium]|uniref:non-specific protein-tyrosine kinase n=1 Tax=uncultured Thiotrichaceae bacterium TaxID=298394 RepID=A0A6S6TSQ0_9GAMM|nr:MAG: Capsular exopolysaccharide family [uncultured Thiotrichaceae bacterium]